MVLFSSCKDSGNDADQDPEPEPEPAPAGMVAADVIKEMGPGFNLGNTFDNGINTTTLEAVKPLIDTYYTAGMKHIRIPVTWMDRFNDNLADENGNINTENARFKELVKVIDYVLRLELYVVINTHHEHWLKDFYDGSASFDDRFANLWTEIATYFKDYPNKLIFEVLNEPEGKLGEYGNEWPSPNSALALSYTRNVNNVGYEAIRATGGLNETRIVMVSPNGQGNEANIDEVYPVKASLPGGGDDPYLSIQVHSYNPWSFCGQTGSNSNFPGSGAIEGRIKTVADHAELLGVPINYGEFGVGRDANAAERNTDLVRGYYKTFANTTLSENMSYSVWDDRGWFGLVTGDGSAFVHDIVPTMLE